MDVVELLISISRTKKERHDRVLGGEEEDDRELGKREEACFGASISQASERLEDSAYLRGWGS